MSHFDSVSTLLHQARNSAYEAVSPAILFVNRSASSSYSVIINIPRVLQIEGVALTALQWFIAFVVSAQVGAYTYIPLRFGRINEKIAGVLGVTAAAVTCAAVCLHYIGKNGMSIIDDKERLIKNFCSFLYHVRSKNTLSNIDAWTIDAWTIDAECARRIYGNSGRIPIGYKFNELSEFVASCVKHTDKFAKDAISTAAEQAFTEVMVVGFASDVSDQGVATRAYQAGVEAAFFAAEFAILVNRTHNLTEIQKAIKDFRKFITKNEARIQSAEIVRSVTLDMVMSIEGARKKLKGEFENISSDAARQANRAILDGLSAAIKQATDPIISALADTYTQAIDAGQGRDQAHDAIQTQFLALQANLDNIRTQVKAAVETVYRTLDQLRDQHA
jgi:formiminotetrahydrofolate cyclodeaminase